MQAAGRSIINLGIGQPDFRTPDHIVEAGRKALADGHHGYTPANGIPALREAVAADVARYRRVEIDPDNVVVVPGGKVTMFFAALMFGEPGAEILYPNPGFPIYESAIRFSGATAVPIPLYEETGFSFDADEVLSKITPRTRLVMLNSPANPTGGVVPRETFDRLAEGLEAHPHVAIMSDEIYSRLLYEGREHVTLLDYPAIRDRVIVLERLEQDLRHDRLAHRLRGLARGARAPGDAPCDQLQLLRQRADPARGAGGAHRTAGFGRDHAPHLR